MKKALGAQFYAWGGKELPRHIEVRGAKYNFQCEFKHDFFAATGLYKLSSAVDSATAEVPQKVVLKVYRLKNFLGLPMQWLGRGVCEHEISNLKMLGDIERIPQFLCRYGKWGMVYKYIEGSRIKKGLSLPEDFFDKLRQLLDEIHGRRVVYLDMNKWGNIIAGGNGEPYLIDFQIAIYIPRRILISRRLSDRLLNILKKADIYHLYKLKRKLQPHCLTEQQLKISRDRSNLIEFHRKVATPIRGFKRSAMKFLREKGYLFREQNLG